jgi:hypothetical protein
MLSRSRLLFHVPSASMQILKVSSTSLGYMDFIDEQGMTNYFPGPSDSSEILNALSIMKFPGSMKNCIHIANTR